MQTPIDPLVADAVCKLDDNLREAFEERAGIIEFDAGLPCAHAECLALLGILINHPNCLIDRGCQSASNIFHFEHATSARLRVKKLSLSVFFVIYW